MGKDLFAVFSELACSFCRAFLGKKYHSLPKGLEYLPVEVSLIQMNKVLLYDPKVNNYVNDVRSLREFSAEYNIGEVIIPKKEEFGCRGKVKDISMRESFQRE